MGKESCFQAGDSHESNEKCEHIQGRGEEERNRLKIESTLGGYFLKIQLQNVMICLYEK